MSDEQDPCLTAPEILDYLDGELPAGRKAEIERHLDECRLCEGAVEGVRGLEWREGFLKSTDSVLARVRTRTATTVAAAAAAPRKAPRFRPMPQYLTLAATLVVGVGAVVILSRPGPGEALFQRQFEPYPSTRPVVRGGPEAAGSNALQLYEAHDYRSALTAFDETLRREPKDPVAHFYAGLSRLALGEAREATVDLEEVLRHGDSGLRAPAEWYLALAHLRNQDHAPEWYSAFVGRGGHDFTEARSRLKQIAESGGFYEDKARALLSELDRLDGR